MVFKLKAINKLNLKVYSIIKVKVYTLMIVAILILVSTWNAYGYHQKIYPELNHSIFYSIRYILRQLDTNILCLIKLITLSVNGAYVGYLMLFFFYFVCKSKNSYTKFINWLFLILFCSFYLILCTVNKDNPFINLL